MELILNNVRAVSIRIHYLKRNTMSCLEISKTNTYSQKNDKLFRFSAVETFLDCLR